MKVKSVVVALFPPDDKQARRDSVHGDSECAKWMSGKCNNNNFINVCVGEQPLNSRNSSW